MPFYTIFLRAVNVGGNSSIKMSEFQSALTDAGFAKVRTVLNSGNAVFESDAGYEQVCTSVAIVIAESFSAAPEFILKTDSELSLILKSNPFTPEQVPDGSKMVAAMLTQFPDEQKAHELETDDRFSEPRKVAGDVVYIYYTDGIGRSKLTNAAIEKRLGVASTSRNWNTLEKMAELVSSG